MLHAQSTIRVGIYNNEPLIFADEHGNGKGFFADIIEHIASKEKWQIKYVPGTWNQCLSRLENDEIDILCVIAFSRSRDKLYDFNKNNLLTNWGQLYTLEESDIIAITDVAEKKIAVLKNDIHHKIFTQILDNFGINSKIIEADDYHSVLDMVSKKQADAGVVNRFFGMKYGDKYNVDKSGVIFNPIKIHFAFPEGQNRELIAAIDKNIELLKGQPGSVYYKSMDQWLGTVSMIKVFPAWLIWFFIACTGSVILLFLGNRILRHQVNIKTQKINNELNLRQNAEEKLRQETERFRILSDLTFEGIVIHLNGKVMDTNEAFLKMIGYTREEVLDRNIINLCISPEYHSIIKKMIKKNIAAPYDIVAVKKNGTTFPVEIEAKDTEYNNKNFRVAAIRDIADRKISEKTLKQSEEKYRTMIEHSNDMIWTLDNAGNFTFLNRHAENISGLKLVEWKGKSFAPLIMKEDLPSIMDTFNRTINGESINYELRLKKEDGKILTISVNTAPLFENGKISGIVSFGRDITDRRKLELQLQRSQKMEAIGTLAGGIAHDFNNILFPIMGYTEIMMGDIPEDSPFQGSLNKIYTAALRARDLVTQILTFSRQENSEFKLIKIQPVIKEALKLIRSSLPTTIEIIQDLNPDCGIIKADPTKIHQIIMNLATNAYHAMEKTGGQLRVSLEQIRLEQPSVMSPDMAPGPYACLVITDSGIGMDKELIRKIFDPFFSTKEKGKGTGLGLSVVHGIITDMGGFIQVDSQPGKGTKFKVYLPIEHNSFEKQNIHKRKSIQGGDEHILLVDDEKEIVEMVQSMLEELGYKITSYTSSIQTIDAFQAHPEQFDLVITDMTMPNIPGDQLAETLIKIRPELPVLLCTGFSETMSEEKAASLGIKGFLLKPIEMHRLAQKIREVLNKKE